MRKLWPLLLALVSAVVITGCSGSDAGEASKEVPAGTATAPDAGTAGGGPKLGGVSEAK